MYKWFHSLLNEQLRPFISLLYYLSLIAFLLISCKHAKSPIEASNELKVVDCPADSPLIIQADSFYDFELVIPQSGRYRLLVRATSDSGQLWVEDYVGNPDGRTYDISGKITPSESGQAQPALRMKDGSPMQAGNHHMRLHASKEAVAVYALEFELLISGRNTEDIRTQNMQGENWVLKWSDEFNGNGLPDSNHWSYNLGNWGWGNNELQYYTVADTKNAKQQDGLLLIQALKDEKGDWTSARLTTQGKIAFKYGKIEFRAKVPNGLGSWSAGWLLGDDYKDEISWPYCGEIDVLECVGFEFDSTGLHGKNHASCHTRAYYFKQGNQITAATPVSHMSDSFHTYAIEWYPNIIHASVDGKRYYTYDKTADSLEWPFHKAQSIILNLAIGGGWGGAKGCDPQMKKQQLWIDYVRVYGKE